MNQITGYHFTSATLRNGEPIPPIGEWLVHAGEIIPCSSGLHASVKVLDALQYAPGAMLHKVILSGELQSHGNPIDKYVGRKRKILASIDATQILRDFARWCALSVADKWDCPTIVRTYLQTGDETLRDAAMTAARTAAWNAARDAARDAAWAAAGDAAWDAAGAAARAAAWDAARAAARDAAGAAARAAALAAASRAAAWAAAGDAAWDAAGAAAWAAASRAAASRAAAWAAARAAQGKHLQRMVKEEIKGL